MTRRRGGTTDPDSPLTVRVRTALADDPSTREVPMFGGLSFMVDEKMLVSVGRDGTLLVRIDPDRHRALLEVPGTRPAEMGTGRPMGPSWIRVDPDALGTDDAVRRWITVAREHRAASTGRDTS